MKSWCLVVVACVALACGSENAGPTAPSDNGGASLGGAALAGASGSASPASAGTAEQVGGGASVGVGGAGNAGAANSGASGMPSAGTGQAGGGGSEGGSEGGSGGTTATTAGTPTFVAVGYKGLRVRSTDLGVTWTDSQTLGADGDNEFLLRAVSFGKGVFVALGWKVLSSTDGKTWTEGTNPQHQWLGGVQFSDAGFVAVGGYGYSALSSDGMLWKVGGSMPNNEASRSLAFGSNKFVSATDPGNWYESSDGSSWSLLSGGHTSNQVAYCSGAFKDLSACSGAFNARGRATAQGVTLRLNNGKLERSTDGSVFNAVADSPSELEDVAVGYPKP
jgi:hypothetical protein